MNPKVPGGSTDRITSRPMLRCPHCSSNFLMIRTDKGVERLMIFLTGLRKYMCRDCERSFRAPDRRQIPREDRLPASSRVHPI